MSSVSAHLQHVGPPCQRLPPVPPAAATPARQAFAQRLSSHLRASASGRGSSGSSTYHCSSREQQLQPVSSAATDSAVAAEAPSAHASAHGNGAAPTKLYDLVALSNLCVDVVVNVPELPPDDEASRRALLAELSSRPLPFEAAEVGGNTNTLISAARLGLRAVSVGHVGPDPAGQFLSDVLAAEGIQQLVPVASEPSQLSAEQAQTLLCFVLVDPAGRHAFCSRYDFGPHPMLSFVRKLPPSAEAALDACRALWINGFVFDELPAKAVLGAGRRAAAGGAAVFFDPGPRAWTFSSGERAAALSAMLDLSDVVLMTAEEGEAVTGLRSAEAQARHVLARPGARTHWCIIKMGAEGALLAIRDEQRVYHQEAIAVDVSDTVGCGDSFAAAVVLGYLSDCRHVETTLALAAAVGAATATGTGAGRNVARAETVAQLLQGKMPCPVHGGALDMLLRSVHGS